MITFKGMINAYNGGFLDTFFKNGSKPKIDELTDWEFDGYNLTPLADLLRIRKFRKGFYEEDGELKGYNVKMKQNKFEKPWIIKGQTPQRFGWYDVFQPEDISHNIREFEKNYVLLHYGNDKRNGIFQGKLLRDFLVQVDPDVPELLIGKAYNALGKKWIFPSYFVLKRVQKSDFKQ